MVLLTTQNETNVTVTFASNVVLDNPSLCPPGDEEAGISVLFRTIG